MRDTSLVLAAREAVYGTAPALTPAANALAVRSYAPEPALYDEKPRNISTSYPGARPSAMTRGRQRHVFEFEVAGSGEPATPASWSTWLGAAMFGAAVPAADEVGYPLIAADDGASVALYGWKGEMRTTPIGMRGNIVFNFNEGDVPFAGVDLLGLLPALPTKAAQGVPVFPDEPDPLEVNTQNTVFMLGGFALKLRSFSLDLGMKTELRTLVGQNSIIFGSDQSGDRRQAGGRIVAELPDLDAKNFFGNVPAQDDLALSLIHGPDSNQVEFASARLRLKPLAISSEQGRLMMTANYALVPSAANNEFTLTTR